MKYLKIYSYIGVIGGTDFGSISWDWKFKRNLDIGGSNLLVLGQVQLSIPKEKAYKKAIWTSKRWYFDALSVYMNQKHVD